MKQRLSREGYGTNEKDGGSVWQYNVRSIRIIKEKGVGPPLKERFDLYQCSSQMPIDFLTSGERHATTAKMQIMIQHR